MGFSLLNLWVIVFLRVKLQYCSSLKIVIVDGHFNRFQSIFHMQKYSIFIIFCQKNHFQKSIWMFFFNLWNFCSPPRNVYNHIECKYLFNCSFTMCRIMSNSIQISFHINSHLSYLLSSAWSQQTDLLGQTMCDDQKCHRHLCECYLRFDYFCFFFK